MVTRTQVHKYLQSLGNSADAVAATLRSQGLKGRPVSASRCVITVAVQKKFPSLKMFSISQHSFTLGAKSRTRDENRRPGGHLETPEAVRQFISKFDTGDCYRDLVAPVV
jgi:hypothetical protein